jgi:hypothetical protein
MARRYCSCLRAASEDRPLLSRLSFLKVSTTTLVNSSRPCPQQRTRIRHIAAERSVKVSAYHKASENEPERKESASCNRD